MSPSTSRFLNTMSSVRGKSFDVRENLVTGVPPGDSARETHKFSRKAVAGSSAIRESAIRISQELKSREGHENAIRTFSEESVLSARNLAVSYTAEATVAQASYRLGAGPPSGQPVDFATGGEL